MGLLEDVGAVPHKSEVQSRTPSKWPHGAKKGGVEMSVQSVFAAVFAGLLGVILGVPTFAAGELIGLGVARVVPGHECAKEEGGEVDVGTFGEPFVFEFVSLEATTAAGDKILAFSLVADNGQPLLPGQNPIPFLHLVLHSQGKHAGNHFYSASQPVTAIVGGPNQQVQVKARIKCSGADVHFTYQEWGHFRWIFNIRINGRIRRGIWVRHEY